MNLIPRTTRKAPLFVGALAAVTLTGFAWAQSDADAAKPSAPPEKAEKCDKCDGPKGKGPGPRGDHWRGDRRGRPERFGHGPGALLRDLDLTAEQKEKVKAVMEAQKPKLEAIRNEERAKMKAVFDEAEKEIRPILTKEQQQVLDDAKKLQESKAALKKDDKKDGAKPE